MTAYTEVVCPTCHESFEVPAPALSEVPCEWDYDCEVCCAPMRIVFSADDELVVAEARGLGE
ncbi:MAG: CPXCG motif-containing cysteine-rich protein [Chthoniobacterales bacterium]|nr:CPXCG motif-containing cysteine-rich protein [Chthoniobacterales bacterium]